VGPAELDDLTLVAPLVLDARGAAQVQVTVGEADEQDRRPLNIYSRQEDGAGDEPGDGEWTLHASGRLAPGAASDARDEELEAFAAASWPPEDAEEVDLEPFYGRLFDLGYHYGPAFRGLRQAFQAGAAWE